MISIIKSSLEGVVKIIPEIYNDQRGKFFEAWNEKHYKNITAGLVFCQDNISYSQKNVIRGLHFQYPKNEQGKLISVLYGKIFDVAVDIRKNSPSFRNWEGFILEDKKNHQLWIPPGFAHGFCVLSNHATVQYKCTSPWSKLDENTIRWNDPTIKINWPTCTPILSNKDETASFLNNQKKLPEYKNE